jgi:F-type H+-transporting ATPase subunit b
MEMMGTLFTLVAELGSSAADMAEEVEGHSFGLNVNLLDTNLINLVIIIGVLVYFGRGFLGKTLADRRANIEQAIREAEERKKNAAAALAEEQQKLAQAQTEAARIRLTAEENAKSARESILAQAERDIERLRATAQQDLSNQQERVINELRQRVAALAMQRAEDQLKSQLNDNSQQQLIDRSIAMLGGRS